MHERPRVALGMRHDGEHVAGDGSSAPRRPRADSLGTAWGPASPRSSAVDERDVIARGDALQHALGGAASRPSPCEAQAGMSAAGREPCAVKTQRSGATASFR